MKYLSILALASVLALSSCATRAQSGAAAGGAAGAVAGQLLGKNTESTAIGTAVGAAAGYMIGNEMDKTDQNQIRQRPRR